MTTALVIGVVLITIFAVGSIVVALSAGWMAFALVRGLVRVVLPSRRQPPVTAQQLRAGSPPPEQVWRQARQRFHHLRAEYADYECDPMRVLHLPALADVSVASTARFVDAFAEAQGLETDTYPGPAHVPKFVTAVDRAEKTWRAAQDAAARIRLNGLGPAERGTVERIIKLLTTARDSDSEPERLAAYTRARAELAKLDRAGVVHMPQPAQAAFDAAARGQLPRPQP